MKKNVLTATAIASVLSLATLGGAATNASAEDMEKCYGVVKAGHNDCGGKGHSCAGQAQVDGDPHEWVMVPAGLCDKLVGGSTSPGNADKDHE